MVDEQFARLLRDGIHEGLRVDYQMTICLHRDGSMSISGATADKAFNLRVIDEARAALARQPDAVAILTPGADVDVRAQAAYGVAK